LHLLGRGLTHQRQVLLEPPAAVSQAVLTPVERGHQFLPGGIPKEIFPTCVLQPLLSSPEKLRVRDLRELGDEAGVLQLADVGRPPVGFLDAQLSCNHLGYREERLDGQATLVFHA
ncbi:MAG: hypothetical protein ACK56F_09735, partial [bacterium]